MIALGWWACRPAPDPVRSTPTHSGAGDERPAFAEPPDAPDLDPADDVLHVALTAAPHELWVDGVRYEGAAFEGSVPGPTIRAVVGDTVVVDVTNGLDAPTTVHWHGLRAPAEADGAGWPMPEIAPGATFTARFVVDRPGTFWYHPHLDTDHQVDHGLYGVVVVRDPTEPEVDHDLVLVVDAFGEAAASDADHHVDPSPATWPVNGLVDPVLDVAAGETVRARLVNVANTGYLALADQRILATDQGLGSALVSGTLVLAPGDRAEVEWRVAGPAEVSRLPWSPAGEALSPPARLLSWSAEPGDPPTPVDWPFDGAAPTPDPGTTDLRFLLSGSPELGWELNGETFPDVTRPALALGQEAILEVRDVSPTHHPFHVHGHTFEVLSVNGVAPAHRQLEDTLDIGIYDVVRLRLVADNPGSWMVHCHLLPHAEGGMMTLLDVR